MEFCRMARRTDQSIHLAKTRQNLLPRREPYWRCLVSGGHIGFRKTKTGSETYVARWRDEFGRRHYKSMGRHTYDDAKECAEHWIADCKAGIVRDATVQACLESYVGNLRAENREAAAIDAEQRFRREIYRSSLGRMELSRLRANHIEQWRDSIGIGKSPASVNRSLSSLKAGLNYGFKRQLVSSDLAWKIVEKLEVAEPARVQYLSLKDRRKLIESSPEDLQRFLVGLSYTGARPGEIAQCRAEDFDPDTGVLILRSRKGRKRQLRERKFTIRADGLAFFRQQYRFKMPRAYLFTKADGRQWLKWLWSKPIREAARRSKLPTGTTAYVIRHSVISDWVRAGIDVASVAIATGTSIQMINDYYFKALPDYTADRLAAIKFM